VVYVVALLTKVSIPRQIFRLYIINLEHRMIFRNWKEKEIPKRQYDMDPAMEDKICDLYDLFVDVHISFAFFYTAFF